MRVDLSRIRKLKGAFQGRRIFLIGNGPSVRLDDLEKLSGEVCFCANRFHLCYEQTSFRPTLTFLEDKKMIENHLEEIASSCETALLVPGRLAPKTDHLYNLVRYILLTQTEEDKITEFSDNLEEGLYVGSSVMFGMLQVALYAGAKEVILYGIDHSFEVPLQEAQTGEAFVIDGGEKNHFISHYRKPGEVWCPPRVREIEEGFHLARKMYEKKGVPLYNATRGGQLEIFERKSFDSFFGFFQSLFSRSSGTKKALLRLEAHPNVFEKSFCDFLKNLGYRVTLGKKEGEEISSYDLVFTTGDPSSFIPEHPSSYYLLSQSFEEISERSSFYEGPFSFRNLDFLRALPYYDAVFVPRAEDKEKLLSYGVERPLYTLSS